jgi:hypothetical protein
MLSLPVGLTAAEPVKSRTFQFTYETTVNGLAKGQTARIWLPVPPSNDEQTVKLITSRLPGQEQIGKEAKYGNQMLFVEAQPGADDKIHLSLTYEVTRKEVKADLQAAGNEKDDAELFLKPDAKVPIGGKPLMLIEGKKLPEDQVQLGRLLYDVVNGHMRYSKEGTGWGRGDAEWACDSKFGNCSDFHSLFISLARTEKIPAKFEIGFPIPEKRGSGDIPGYHCWAKFKPAGKGWIPVDISEANKNPAMKDYYFGNLTENRVTFSVGRDLTLVPKQDGPALNFFVYPYVEVAGKPLANGRIDKRFSYRDLNGGK